MQTPSNGTSTTLSQADARQAEASCEALQGILDNNVQTNIRLSVERSDGQTAELSIPKATLSLLSKILREQGHGKNVVVLATDTEVTTQRAADFLRVSRPYLVKLLEQGTIPYRLVGPRRRVLLADLLDYKEREDAERHLGLDELAAESQRLGLY